MRRHDPAAGHPQLTVQTWDWRGVHLNGIAKRQSTHWCVDDEDTWMVAYRGYRCTSGCSVD
jgi:hypothetical protein